MGEVERMDASRFTDSKTGRLVPISLPEGRDWAFIPDPLPPTWEFPAELWPLLAEAREHLARLDERGRTLGNPSLLMVPLRKREALRSSSLEGTYATPEELLLYEMKPREPVSDSDSANAWREVHNYDVSLRHGFDRLQDESCDGLPLSLRLIREMHGLLMKDVRGDRKRAGQFRDRQVHVGSDRRYIPPPPETLDECLRNLENYLHDHGDRFDPLVLSYIVHYQFEAIHPFMDGNGRIGRALLSLTTREWSGLSMPWLYMSAYFERYRDEYIDNMFRVSTHGDWGRWVEFCLRGTLEQCRDAMRRCEQLNQIRTIMNAAVGSRPRMYTIVERLFFTPMFTTTEVMTWTGSSRPTASADIGVLIENGFVRHLAGQRPRTYFAPAIFHAAYAEEPWEAEGGGDEAP